MVVTGLPFAGIDCRTVITGNSSPGASNKAKSRSAERHKTEALIGLISLPLAVFLRTTIPRLFSIT